MQDFNVRRENNNDINRLNEISLQEGSNLSHRNNYHGNYEQQSLKVYLRLFHSQQQLLVMEYLLSVKRLSTQQLIKQRNDLLIQLEHINKYLNQIKSDLSTNANQLSPSRHKSSKPSPNDIKSQLYQPSPTQLQQSRRIRTQQINEHSQSPNKSIANKKHLKPQIQLTPSSMKLFSKDDLQNLTLNEIDSLSENNLKLIISLQQEIQDYQFMLTPQYSQKLNHQIQNHRQYKKQLQQQILSFNKVIAKQNKNYDQEVMSQLERYSYDKQMELNLLTKKLNFKLSKLESIENQSKQKLKRIDEFSKQQRQLCQILQMYQDEDDQGPQQSKRKEQKYLKLSSKKDKIEKMVNSMNSNKLKEYNKKLSDFRLLQQQIQQYDQLTTQTNNNILTLLNQKQSFNLQYKHLINKGKKISNLQIHESKLIPIEHSKSSPIRNFVNTKRQYPNQETKQQLIPSTKQLPISNKSSFLHQNKSKYFSQHSNSKNQQIDLIQSSDQHQNNSQSFKNQQKSIFSQPQHVKRRRIYTQLENNHYFTSLERNHHKQITPSPKESNQNNVSMKFLQNQVPFTKKQRKLNSSASAKVRVGGQTKVKIYKSQKKQTEIDEEKYVIDRDIMEVEERLRKLQQFLGKEEITLSALKRMQNRLSLQNSNRKLKFRNHGINGNDKNQKNKSFDEIYQSEQFQELSHRKESKMNVRQRHYKELCQRLGKNKLLIEEDTDIRGLIYQGISGDGRN